MSRALLVALCACLGACATTPRRPTAAGALRFTCTPADAHIVLDEDDLGPCVVWGTRWLGLVPVSYTHLTLPTNREV